MIMLVLMGYIHVAPSAVDDFHADVQEISRSTRAENGCLFYGISLDDRVAGRFLVAERWRDEDALKTHLQRQETVVFLEKWSGSMKGDLQAYNVQGQRTLAN